MFLWRSSRMMATSRRRSASRLRRLRPERCDSASTFFTICTPARQQAMMLNNRAQRIRNDPQSMVHLQPHSSSCETQCFVLLKPKGLRPEHLLNIMLDAQSLMHP